MFKYTNRVLWIWLLTVLTAAWAAALEPPTPEQLAQYRQDGTLAERMAFAKELGNHKAAPQLVERWRFNLERRRLKEEGYSEREIGQLLAPPPGWRGMPTRGTVRVLALLIAFDDYPPMTEASVVESNLFGAGNGAAPYESLRAFYQRSSYNQLDIQGDALGWYYVPYSRDGVPQTRAGRENLIRDALLSYDAQGHDFTQYDNDGDGVIDYLIVVWTGPDNGWSNFWWGYMTNYLNDTVLLDGKTLSTYSWQWEANPYGNLHDPRVVIHETGHALGLPDYYDYDNTVGPKGGVGGLDQMDGNWGDHNCFSKWMLEWLEPEVLNSGSHNRSLRTAAVNPEALAVMPGITPGNPFDQFFMLQNRYRLGNDQPLPSNGILIWHVDARLDDFGFNFLYDNSYSEHKMLRLVQADGLEQIERNNASADFGDYYRINNVFGPNSNPASTRYDGVPTHMTVANFSATSQNMSFTVEFDQQAPGIGAPSYCTGDTTAVIAFDTTEHTLAEIHWGTGFPLPGHQVTAKAAEGHFLALDGLQPDTSYLFQLFARDITGNETQSGYFRFTTVSQPGQHVTAFSDDMENGPAKWQPEPNGSTPWSILSTPNVHSGTHAWFSADPSTAKDDYLLTTPIDLTQASQATLTFWHTYQFEANWDGGVIEISTDGGTNFTDLGADILAGGYDGLIFFTQSAITGREAWTVGVIGPLTPVEVSLDRYTGAEVIVRFRLASDLNTPGVGWYVDDVAVDLITCTPGSPTPWVRGDLDADGAVTAADLLLLSNFSGENALELPDWQLSADLDDDGRLTAVDQVLMARLTVS